MNNLDGKILEICIEKIKSKEDIIIFNNHNGEKGVSIGFKDIDFTKNGNGCFASIGHDNYFISNELYNEVNELLLCHLDYSGLEQYLNDI